MHEIVLAVQHVVANLHVLQTLVGAQRNDPGAPADWFEAEVNEDSTGDAQDPGDGAYTPDVFRVDVADLRSVLGSKRIEFLSEGFELFASESHGHVVIPFAISYESVN